MKKLLFLIPLFGLLVTTEIAGAKPIFLETVICSTGDSYTGKLYGFGGHVKVTLPSATYQLRYDDSGNYQIRFNGAWRTLKQSNKSGFTWMFSGGDGKQYYF